MKRLQSVVLVLMLMTFFGIILQVGSVRADGGHTHPEEKTEMKMEMEMKHKHHAAPKAKEPELPPGTKEVKINLSGPFCHKHPEEITEALMKRKGVVHVEAFSGRRYILVHYDGDQVTPQEMAAVLEGVKGSGWRCKGEVSSKKRTER